MYASFFKYIHHCICILVMVLCWGYRTSPSDSKVDMSDSELGKLVLIVSRMCKVHGGTWQVCCFGGWGTEPVLPSLSDRRYS